MLIGSAFGALLIAAVVFSPHVGADQPDGGVYKVMVSTSDSSQTWTEWISPSTNSWRTEGGGRVKIYDGNAYAVIDPDATQVRIHHSPNGGGTSFVRDSR
jgi:hypothetical protein